MNRERVAILLLWALPATLAAFYITIVGEAIASGERLPWRPPVLATLLVAIVWQWQHDRRSGVMIVDRWYAIAVSALWVGSAIALP